jgi:hypothetical protein
MRRLIGRQYVNSVRALLGDAAAQAASPPDDATLHGFAVIAAAELALPATAVTAYEASARAVAAAVIADPQKLAELVPCKATGPGDTACHIAFIEPFGKRAWRRSLTEDEVALAADVAKFGATHPDVQDFDVGVGDAISFFLQSPYFLYQVEIGEPDPEVETRRWLTPVELATRTSFFLLDTTPDAALIDKAEGGGLADVAALEALATTMLEQPGARAATRALFDEIYKLGEVKTASKEPTLFPTFTPELAASMEEESLRLIEDIFFTRNADARELFTAKHTFVDDKLAQHYGLPAPPSGFAQVSLSEAEGRAGLLGHASWLARFAHPTKTSPTRRGQFVRHAMLCAPVPPPPADVDAELPPDDGTPKTMKQKLQAHQKDPKCGGCHSLIDNIGFGLEHYDPIGAYRTEDAGMPVDSTAEVSDLGKFASARELGELIAKDPRGMPCLIRNYFRQSMGHIETAGEKPALDALEAAFMESGHQVKSMLVKIVTSPAFRMVGPPK